MVALHEDAAREVFTRGCDVDPADGVLDVLRLRGEIEKLVEAVELNSLVIDFAADDGLETKLRPGDHAGEAKTANGRRVHVRVFSRRAAQMRAIRANQLEPRHMAAERAGDVMVLAVDVVGNRATECDVLCSRRDRQKETARNSKVENLRERDAGLCGENARRGIKAEQAVHAGGLDERAVLEQTDVAVAAAHADGQGAVMHAVDDARKLILPVNRAHVSVIDGIAPPGFKGASRALCQVRRWLWGSQPRRACT